MLSSKETLFFSDNSFWCRYLLAKPRALAFSQTCEFTNGISLNRQSLSQTKQESPRRRRTLLSPGAEKTPPVTLRSSDTVCFQSPFILPPFNDSKRLAELHTLRNMGGEERLLENESERLHRLGITGELRKSLSSTNLMGVL